MQASGVFKEANAFEKQFKETNAFEQRQLRTKKLVDQISKAREEIGNKVKEQSEQDRPVIDTIPEEEAYVPEADLRDDMRVPDFDVLRELRDRCRRAHRGDGWSSYKKTGKKDGTRIDDHLVYTMSKQWSTCLPWDVQELLKIGNLEGWSNISRLLSSA